MLLILTVLCLAFKAHASDISIHGTTTAVYGGEASFTCTLSDPTGVLQVTWQRGLKPESLENMATYNKPVGKQVNDPFKGKVSFGEASLSSSSIILRNVTWEDENCYVCSFNAYPDGSKRKQVCLKVEGISAHTRNSFGPKGRAEILSCSATGRPTPTIKWNIQGDFLKDQQQSTSRNSDGTSTASSNITVEIPADWTGRVNCVMNEGMEGELQEEFQFSPVEEEKMEGNRSKPAVIVAVLAVIVGVIVTAAVVIRKSRLKRRNDEFTAV